MKMIKQTVISAVNAIIAGIFEYYETYPKLTTSKELCAFYRAQNQRFRYFFLDFSVGLMVIYFIMNASFILDGLPLIPLLRLMATHATIISALIILCSYVLRIGQPAALREKKCDLATQEAVLWKFMWCGAAPTIIFTFGPIYVLESRATKQENEMAWMLYCVLQIQLTTWNIGEVTYKFILATIFSTGYCCLAFALGYFEDRFVIRILIPIVLSNVSTIIVDRYVKENFILKRTLRHQRNMYQYFFQQIQDPVLILSNKGLIFQNQAAIAKLGISNTNYYGQLRAFVSSRGWTLEDYMRVRLEDDVELADSTETLPERYKWTSNAGGEERLNADLAAVSAGTEGRVKKEERTVKVTLMESNDLDSSISGFDKGSGCHIIKKAVAVFIHDVTDEMQQEEKKAEEKFKNVLLFSLSHELKTPINIFQRFISESKKLIARTDSTRSLLLEAKGAWCYLRNKINDILDYAQILSGEFSLHPGSFSIKRFLRYLRKVTSFLLTSKQKYVSLDFRADESVSDLLYADRERIEQVLFNLLSNATRFTERGCISLRIVLSDDKDTVRFSVHDTGCGMSKETVEKLFTFARGMTQNSRERLNRLARSGVRKRATGLSGLGLTVSKMVCDKMGTDLTVSSEPARGSTFSFSVPARSPPAGRHMVPEQKTAPAIVHADEHTGSQDSVAEEDPRKCTLNASSISAPMMVAHRPQGEYTAPAEERRKKSHLQTRVALVVDDNEFNRYVAERMIKKFGFRTVTAENGREAIETLRKIQAEDSGLPAVLVFMDVDMPVMDGIEATVSIRRDCGHAPRPIIVALTAFSAETERKKCFDAGMDAFIDKPLTKERLYEVLCDVGIE